ncbi:MAG: hypothetical protein ACR2OR_04945 [Hyphomicrobiales bacterium]
MDFQMRFLGSVLFFAAGLFLDAPNVQSHDAPGYYPWGNIYTWENETKLMLDELADAESLLGKKKYKNYKHLLDTAQCDEAENLLRTGFTNRYLQFANINDLVSENYKEWRYSFLDAKYRDLQFCFSVKLVESLKLAYRETPEGGIYYTHRQMPMGPQIHWDGVYFGIRQLYTLADQQYLPSIVLLADLAGMGLVFKNSAEVEYFMLHRACKLNYRCGEIRGRIEILEADLPAEKKTL